MPPRVPAGLGAELVADFPRLARDGTFRKIFRNPPPGVLPIPRLLAQHLSLALQQGNMVAAKAKPVFEDEAKVRMKAGTPASIEARGYSADKAAAALNVSGASVERASKVLRDGAPELVAAVEQEASAEIISTR